MALIKVSTNFCCRPLHYLQFLGLTHLTSFNKAIPYKLVSVMLIVLVRTLTHLGLTIVGNSCSGCLTMKVPHFKLVPNKSITN